jgi:DNA-binding CsgD family transcriptional regulator
MVNMMNKVLIESTENAILRMNSIYYIKKTKGYLIISDNSISTCFFCDLSKNSLYINFDVPSFITDTLNNSAFETSRFRKSLSFSFKNYTVDETHLNFDSIAAPIYQEGTTIIGYVGMYVKCNGDFYGFVSFIECMAAFISLIIDNNTHSNKPNDAILKKLSARECEVFKLIVEGKKNREIGERLNISLSTVNTHTQNILYKMETSSKMELITKFYNNVAE